MRSPAKIFFEGKKRRLALITLVAIGAIIAIVAITRYTALGDSGPKLPANVLNRITTFTPYFYNKGVPGGFVVNEKSTSFQAGILVLQLHNAALGQTVTVTEQPLPSEVSEAAYPNATKVLGADGGAIIKYEGTRVMGGLFSTEHNGAKTLVIITSSDPIPQGQIEDLLRGLRPVN